MSIHELTPAQLKRIRHFIEDEWVAEADGDEDIQATETNLKRLLAEIETPTELHWCAMMFNWDTECETLRPLVRHPLCDRGTALGVFWLGQPSWHYGRSASELSEDAQTVRALLEEIEEQFCANAYAQSTIRLNPADMDGQDFTADTRTQTVWDRPIPPVMFEPTYGASPIRPEL
ncbi:MAG: hypothetical protein DRJ42_21550 [Deltaproteobacteria bacterium]|nr:MAG: hypothetical protein DRJ42_21550 [Deltaproteobacteria bacterium]